MTLWLGRYVTARSSHTTGSSQRVWHSGHLCAPACAKRERLKRRDLGRLARLVDEDEVEGRRAARLREDAKCATARRTKRRCDQLCPLEARGRERLERFPARPLALYKLSHDDEPAVMRARKLMCASAACPPNCA